MIDRVCEHERRHSLFSHDRASTVLDWFEAGKLPGFKLGRAVRFQQSEIAEWVHAQRVEAERAA